MRRAASLMWLRTRLGLRCYTLCIMHALWLRICTLLWCSLARLPSNIGLLGLLGLVRLLLGLLKSKKLLLLLDILRLSMGHLLWKVHL